MNRKKKQHLPHALLNRNWKNISENATEISLHDQYITMFIRDGNALLLLRPRQCNPQPAPGAEFVVLRKDILHFRGRIPGRKRTDVPVVWHFTPALLQSSDFILEKCIPLVKPAFPCNSDKNRYNTPVTTKEL